MASSVAALSGVAITITGTTSLPGPAPDLQVASVTAPSSGQAGDSVTISWTVDNAGNGGTKTAFWYDNVYVSPTPSGAGATLLGEMRTRKHWRRAERTATAGHSCCRLG